MHLSSLFSLLEINPALWLKVGRKGTKEMKIGGRYDFLIEKHRIFYSLVFSLNFKNFLKIFEKGISNGQLPLPNGRGLPLGEASGWLTAPQ